jgi:hypothetical protein
VENPESDSLVIINCSIIARYWWYVWRPSHLKINVSLRAAMYSVGGKKTDIFGSREWWSPVNSLNISYHFNYSLWLYYLLSSTRNIQWRRAVDQRGWNSDWGKRREWSKWIVSHSRTVQLPLGGWGNIHRQESLQKLREIGYSVGPKRRKIW